MRSMETPASFVLCGDFTLKYITCVCRLLVGVAHGAGLLELPNRNRGSCRSLRVGYMAWHLKFSQFKVGRLSCLWGMMLS